MDVQQLGEERESWCAVELNKYQSWCRAERQHYRENFQSTAFSPERNIITEPRCQWKVDEPTHREKRHFAIHHSCQLKF